MSETRTIQVFTFEQLSDEAPRREGFTAGATSPKERARYTVGAWIQEYRNEGLNDLFSLDLAEYGFPVDSIEWSLGYSQGDGVAFYGTVDVEVYCRHEGILRRMRPLLAADVDVAIRRNDYGHHYSHWNTMSVDVEYAGTETPRRDALVEELAVRLGEDAKNVSRELERMGYAELDVTDEMIAEECEDNETRFLVDGKVAPS